MNFSKRCDLLFADVKPIASTFGRLFIFVFVQKQPIKFSQQSKLLSGFGKKLTTTSAYNCQYSSQDFFSGFYKLFGFSSHSATATPGSERVAQFS